MSTEKKIIGSYWKRVEVAEGSAELADILRGIYVEQQWCDRWQNCWDGDLKDYIRKYASQLEQDYAHECTQSTESELLERLPSSGDASFIIKRELHRRWGSEFAGASLETLGAALTSSSPGSVQREWLRDQLQAATEAEKARFKKKRLADLQRLATQPGKLTGMQKQLLAEVISEREEHQVVRATQKAEWAKEKAVADAMSITDLLEIEPRRWRASPRLKRYRLKVIRERAVSASDISDLVGIDWWSVDDWIWKEKMHRHNLGTTRAMTAYGLQNEHFYDRAILDDIKNTAAYLAKYAVQTGEPLPPEKDRLMMALGIQDPENQFVRKYAEFVEKWKKQTGAA